MRRHRIRLSGADYREQLDLLLAVGAVKVTRVDEYAKRTRSLSLQHKRNAGTMPAHLRDPKFHAIEEYVC